MNQFVDIFKYGLQVSIIKALKTLLSSYLYVVVWNVWTQKLLMTKCFLFSNSQVWQCLHFRTKSVSSVTNSHKTLTFYCPVIMQTCLYNSLDSSMISMTLTLVIAKCKGHDKEKFLGDIQYSVGKTLLLELLISLHFFPNPTLTVVRLVSVLTAHNGKKNPQWRGWESINCRLWIPNLRHSY